MTSIILKSLALATVLVASAPAFAAPSNLQQKTVLKFDAKTGQYCVTEPAMTGTRINRKICRTAAQWSEAGLSMPKSTELAQK
ncbi:hypothetical protein [Sphingomonas faeni]|uniref:hypothetical protein n=1 Tax=Sphingomonas faeni TaxID=185950 RepID=UPI00334FF4FD